MSLGGQSPDSLSGQKGSIDIEMHLSHACVPVSVPGAVWLLVKLKAASHAVAARLPLNLALVLDRSGSMLGEPLDYVKKAAAFVTERLSQQDVMALITFDDQVDVLIRPQPLADKDGLRALIEQITSGGSTNLSGGLLRGYQEASSSVATGRVSRIILLTDGQANVGVTDPHLLAARVAQMVEHGVQVSTLGVGTSFNEDLLQAVAVAGKGNYYYIKNPDEIPRVFDKEITGLLSVAAQSVRLSVNGRSGCGVTKVLRYEPVFSGADASIDFPDFYTGETKALLLEIGYPALPAGEHRLVDLRLEYTDALGNLDAIAVDLGINLSATDAESDWSKPNIEVMKTVELTRVAMAKDQAAQALGKGDFEESQKVLREAHFCLCSTVRDMAPGDAVLREEMASVSEMIERVAEMPARGMHYSVADPSLMDAVKELKYQSYRERRDRRVK